MTPIYVYVVVVEARPYLDPICRRYDTELNRNPPEGVSVGLVDDDNIFEWELLIVGPPDTLYEVSIEPSSRYTGRMLDMVRLTGLDPDECM